jgi:uncharacterized membrane protein
MPAGSLWVGTGLIFLSVNVIRFLQRLPTSLFTIFLGILAVTGGIHQYRAINFPVFPLLFISMGIVLLLKPKLSKLKN